MLSTLLNEMDGIEKRAGVYIVAATNRLHALVCGSLFVLSLFAQTRTFVSYFAGPCADPIGALGRDY